MRAERALVLVLYFLSGACGLIYEVVWTRQLSLSFGITVFATSAVLASFMAGLGLGSFWVARWIDRVRNPLRVYAWLEAGIGLYALAVPLIFSLLQPLYITIANALEGHFLLFNFIRGMMAFVVLLVPATLMGGTLPAMGRYLVERVESVGWNVGLLYALNTAGAVGGVVLAGFVMIGSLGLWHTTLVAAVFNLAIAAGILVSRLGEPAGDFTPPPVENRRRPARGIAILAGTVFAVSGFAAMAYEVIWSRVLVMYLYNSTYAFSTMLAVFLLGIAVGDAILMRYYDRIRQPIFWLGTVQIAIAISVVVAAQTFGGMAEIGTENQGSFFGAIGLMALRSGSILFPTALLLGMTFPLVARVVCGEFESVGRDLGNIYGANTLGGVFGSLAGGFVLIPLFGLRGTLIFLIVVNATLAATCWWVATRGLTRGILATAAVLIAGAPVYLISPTLFFDALERDGLRLLFYLEGVTDTTGVWQGKDGSRIVTYGDMRGTAGTGSNYVNRVQGHMAHLLHPDPKVSLQIGFGVGNTLASAALHPEVNVLQCAELSPHVHETAPYFWTNDNVLKDPKVEIVVEDGRNYLLRTDTMFDVITLEPPDIFTASVINLYTEEFYRLAYDHLTEDGVLSQWIPASQVSQENLKRLTRSMQNVFPHTSFWRQGTALGASVLLIGTKQPLRIDLENLERRMQTEPIAGDLQSLGITAPEKLFEMFIMSPESLRAWTGDGPSVVDDHTVIDFTAPKKAYTGYGLGMLNYMGLTGPESTAEESKANLFALMSLYRDRKEPIAPWIAKPEKP